MQGDEKAFSSAANAVLAVDGAESSYAPSLTRSTAGVSTATASGAAVIDDLATSRGANSASSVGVTRSGVGHAAASHSSVVNSTSGARGAASASGGSATGSSAGASPNGTSTDSSSVQPPAGGQRPNNLSKIRKERMLSKAELARRAGLSVLTVDRIEKGFGCRMDTKRKILEALGLTLSDRVRVFGDEE